MYKLLAGVGIAAAIFASGIGIGWKLNAGKEAEEDLNIVTEEVENHNEDVITLQAHTVEIENYKRKLAEANSRIPTIDSTIDCPVSEFERMWNQAVTNTNTMRITD